VDHHRLPSLGQALVDRVVLFSTSQPFWLDEGNTMNSDRSFVETSMINTIQRQ